MSLNCFPGLLPAYRSFQFVLSRSLYNQSPEEQSSALSAGSQRGWLLEMALAWGICLVCGPLPCSVFCLDSWRAIPLSCSLSTTLCLSFWEPFNSFLQSGACLAGLEGQGYMGPVLPFNSFRSSVGFVYPITPGSNNDIPSYIACFQNLKCHTFHISKYFL